MGHEKCTDGDRGVRCRASDAAAIWDRLKKGTTNYMFRKLAALVFNYCWHYCWHFVIIVGRARESSDHGRMEAPVHQFGFRVEVGHAG